MRLLDLFCGAGGAGMGYHQAGFDVVGVDLHPQPRYPFLFVQADALELLPDEQFLRQFDVIHASPPCQAYSNAQRIQQRPHPDLVNPCRRLLQSVGKPWIIENVMGSPLRDPIMLCGAMFNLRTYRHRIFETSFAVTAPPHPAHAARQAKMGRPVQDGEFIHIVGNFSNVKLAREVLEMPWATRDELREAIPVAYTRWIGERLREEL